VALDFASGRLAWNLQIAFRGTDIGETMLESFVVVAQQHNLAEVLHREVGDDFRLIPLQSVAELDDESQQRVAAVVIRMPSDELHVPALTAEPIAIAPRTLEAQVDVLEQRIIEDSLARNNRRRKETAVELGISRVTLYNKMKKFGML
jgi:DNA-binding NtrC family response regulator